MRKLLELFYYLFNIGPWYVVGEYRDDEGKVHNFITWGSRDGTFYEYDDHADAAAYASLRNEQAATDPLGTYYYVVQSKFYRRKI